MKTGLLAPVGGKERVQPDVEDLVGNMEDNEGEQKKKEEEPKKEEPKLGRMSYKFEYHFQKGEVRSHAYLLSSSTTQASK